MVAQERPTNGRSRPALPGISMRKASPPSVAKNLLAFLVIILIVPFILVALPPFCIYLAVKMLLDRWRDRRWRRKNEGTYFLVWTSRRGWHDFVVNNVLPALPGNVSVVRTGVGEGWLPTGLARGLREAKVCQPPRPYLAVVSRSGVVALPLNDSLRGLKKRSKKQAAIRERVGRIIARSLLTSQVGC
jgi:hypothetical protein